MSTFYEVLDVTQTATEEEIKRAYRKLARACHPDIVQANGGNVHEAQERFKRINHAHEVLSDANKRATYDHSLRRPAPSPAAPARPTCSPSGKATFVAPPPHWSDPYFTDQDRSYDWFYDIDERIRLEEAWQEFVSKPLRWQSRAEAWYGRIGYIIVGVASLLVIGLLMYSGGNLYPLMEYALTTNSAPGVESYVPFKGALIGIGTAIVLTVGVMIYTILSRWSVLCASGDIRGRLTNRLLDMLAQLSIICSLGGFFLARYLF